MRQKTIYICECCGKEYLRSIDAYKCEVECLEIPFESYKKIYTEKAYERDKKLYLLYRMYHDKNRKKRVIK